MIPLSFLPQLAGLGFGGLDTILKTIGGFDQRQQNIAQQADLRNLINLQIDQARPLAEGIRDQQMPQVQQAYQNYQTGLAGLMPMLEGSGAQERVDINRQFNNLGASQAADLTSRGLSASTILPTLQQGTERSRADALGGLEERLRQQRLGLSQFVNSSQLQGRLGGLQDMGRLQMLPFNMTNPLEMSKIGIVGQTQFPYPDMGTTYANAANLGQGFARTPNYNTDQSGSFLNPLFGGLGATGGAIGGKFLLGTCISAKDKVRTSDGKWKSLAEVESGEYVLCPDGIYSEVIDKDHGTVPDPQCNNYLRIETEGETESGPSIVLTTDHVIEGSPASEWRVGDLLGEWKITRISRTQCKASADLLLDGASQYIVNGFIVDSMFVRYGITAKDFAEMKLARK